MQETDQSLQDIYSGKKYKVPTENDIKNMIK
jgi:hypothetical protein